MKSRFLLFSLFALVLWLTTTSTEQGVRQANRVVEAPAEHQASGTIDYPQDSPVLFLHKLTGGEQTLVEQIRFLPGNSYANQLAQTRRPSLFISEFFIQVLHQRAAVPLFIKGRALLC